MLMKREILTFHLWFNLAVKDVFLGHFSLFVSVIQTVKPGTSSQTHMRIGRTKWERGFTGLPGLSYTVWPQQKKLQIVDV